MSGVRRRYLYAAIISHPILLMAADPKELLAWLFYLDLDDRRKKRADEK
jgi:hypothetical protein